MMQGNNVVNGTAVSKCLRRGCIAVASMVLSIVSAAAVAEQSITDISFNSQPNGQLSIALEFDSMPSSEFSSYTIEDPARIVIDFPNTDNQLPQRRYALPSGNAQKRQPRRNDRPQPVRHVRSGHVVQCWQRCSHAVRAGYRQPGGAPIGVRQLRPWQIHGRERPDRMPRLQRWPLLRGGCIGAAAVPVGPPPERHDDGAQPVDDERG